MQNTQSRRGHSPRSIANLKPFRPGKSGNPKGRPRHVENNGKSNARHAENSAGNSAGDFTQNSGNNSENNPLDSILSMDPEAVAGELEKRIRAGDSKAIALAAAILPRFGVSVD